MRFSAIHKVASYLMVAAAFAALALSRELPPAIVLATAGAGLASFFCEPSRVAFFRGRVWTGAWNLATLIAFGWTILDALRGEALFAGVRFLCFLLVNKLFNRRASRDYLQAYVVSFLMLVAGAALSSDLAYAGCFLAYVVFATWTLTLFHLRREMEENYLLKHATGGPSERVEVERILNSRRIVGSSFLFGTALVALGIFLTATIVFFLIPRFGFGFFVTQKRHGAATVGFQDRVDLDQVGLVKDNPQVVMRIELDAPPEAALHLRGVSFDRYQHGHWARTMQLPQTPLRRWDGLWLVGERPPSAPEVRRMLQGRKQVIYLDPLDTPVLFGAAQPLAIELPPARGLGPSPIELERRGDGEVIALERHIEPSGRAVASERKSGLRYTVWSDEPRPPLAKLLSLDDVEVDSPELKPYLQLPSDLPPRVVELARAITKDAHGPFAKALAVERWLATRYRYTLDLTRDERYEPLDDFLFVTRAGHCEYFASAMAILLRAAGVPTRSVNGFLGGEWNSYGNYLAVRQGDAHSWVEAWIEPVGWLTFDPTPPAPGGATSGGWSKLRQLLDNVEMAWFKWIIELDLAKQQDAVLGLKSWASRATSGGSVLGWAKAHARALAALGVLAAALVAWRAWRRRRPAVRGARPRTGAGAIAYSAYQRALRALERRGHARRIGETGRELAVRVERAGDPGARPFAELVELYYRARFGDVNVPHGELDRLAAQVQRPAPLPPPPSLPPAPHDPPHTRV
jgi:protein-glutamine gamma-glutamyltransferase